MADYLIVCADRRGTDRDHRHVARVGVRIVEGPVTLRLLAVDDVRRRIKAKTDRFFVRVAGGDTARVKRRRCKICGCKSIGTKPDTGADEPLARLSPCSS